MDLSRRSDSPNPGQKYLYTEIFAGAYRETFKHHKQQFEKDMELGSFSQNSIGRETRHPPLRS